MLIRIGVIITVITLAVTTSYRFTDTSIISSNTSAFTATSVSAVTMSFRIARFFISIHTRSFIIHHIQFLLLFKFAVVR